MRNVMWILVLLFSVAHASLIPNPTSTPTQTADEIAFLRSELLHVKNAIWGILQGFDKSKEAEVTMGFRDRYTSPYGEAVRKAEDELAQRRMRLFDQCLADALVLMGKYPEGSNLVKVNCDDAEIARTAELQIQQEKQYTELLTMLNNKWSGTWDAYDDEDGDWDAFPDSDSDADPDRFYDA